MKNKISFYTWLKRITCFKHDWKVCFIDEVTPMYFCVKCLRTKPFFKYMNVTYPVLEDAERSEADSTHGEASNH